MKDPIELLRSFHHRSMAAQIDKMQFAVRDQLVKLLPDKWRSYIVIIPPDKQGRLLDLAHFFTRFITLTDGRITANGAAS